MRLAVRCPIAFLGCLNDSIDQSFAAGHNWGLLVDVFLAGLDQSVSPKNILILKIVQTKDVIIR